ncbi:Uncharacterised protein [Segatella copri]|nr:Uncharacterised protein [Segatella copri]
MSRQDYRYRCGQEWTRRCQDCRYTCLYRHTSLLHQSTGYLSRRLRCDDRQGCGSGTE